MILDNVLCLSPEEDKGVGRMGDVYDESRLLPYVIDAAELSTSGGVSNQRVELVKDG